MSLQYPTPRKNATHEINPMNLKLPLQPLLFLNERRLKHSRSETHPIDNLYCTKQDRTSNPWCPFLLVGFRASFWHQGIIVLLLSPSACHLYSACQSSLKNPKLSAHSNSPSGRMSQPISSNYFAQHSSLLVKSSPFTKNLIPILLPVPLQ